MLEPPAGQVKLFYVEEDEINRVSTLLPKELTTIKGTLSNHQVICTTPGTIHYRVLSCFCNREAICPCFHPSSTNIAPQVQPGRDVRTSEPTAPEDGSHSTPSSGYEGTLCPVDDITKDLLGKLCVITYDDNPYPGIIEDIAEGALEVKVMHYIGRNRFLAATRGQDLLHRLKMTKSPLQNFVKFIMPSSITSHTGV
ncbi:hypothetical protein F7725_000079 [Dissostichus mawsoni]|uniref:Uncharacterized protein n=1 Tax=Dissostichus mawsoni TaxID=36200 RepID=A0A7J5ZDC0_DISMA|nr:hypothetical protein F7725_000079 [Dissostichus mawsoni]